MHLTVSGLIVQELLFSGYAGCSSELISMKVLFPLLTYPVLSLTEILPANFHILGFSRNFLSILFPLCTDNYFPLNTKGITARFSFTTSKSGWAEVKVLRAISVTDLCSNASRKEPLFPRWSHRLHTFYNVIVNFTLVITLFIFSKETR